LCFRLVIGRIYGVFYSPYLTTKINGMNERKKVLIVDDEIELCQLLKSYFEKRSCEVFISHTIESGIEALKSGKMDIVFLDNNLPDGSGWSLAPQLAIDSPETHITLVSGYYPKVPSMPEAARYSVIEKPVSFSDIDKHLVDLFNGNH
jgi:DNA-binding NtrC family response regulator